MSSNDIDCLDWDVLRNRCLYGWADGRVQMFGLTGRHVRGGCCTVAQVGNKSDNSTFFLS